MSYCLKLLKVNSHGPAATLQGCLSKKRCPCWNFHRHRESKDSCPHGYEDAGFLLSSSNTMAMAVLCGSISHGGKMCVSPQPLLSWMCNVCTGIVFLTLGLLLV